MAWKVPIDYLAMGSVIKSQGLARVLDGLTDDEVLAVILTMTLGSEEEKTKLAAAFERRENKQPWQ
jgi:hypothetical protein